MNHLLRQLLYRIIMPFVYLQHTFQKKYSPNYLYLDVKSNRLENTHHINTYRSHKTPDYF